MIVVVTAVFILVDRKEWRPVSYEEAKTSLEAELFEEKVMEEYRAWMDERREETFIERRGYFADAADFESGAEEPPPFEASLGGMSVLGGGAEEDSAQ